MGAFVNGLASKHRDVKFITVNADRMPVCFSFDEFRHQCFQIILFIVLIYIYIYGRSWLMIMG